MHEMAAQSAGGPLDEALISVDVECDDRASLLRDISSQLVRAGYVRETFGQALLDREETFPTGLPTKSMHVAIPHTDVEHVIAPAIAVARLAAPVTFGEMGSRDRTVDVELVLVLAVADSSEQLGLLQELIGMFSDGDLMTALRGAPTANDLFTLINERITPALSAAPEPDGGT